MMNDKKISITDAVNQFNKKGLENSEIPASPIINLYTNMFCADELQEYDTIYFNPSNVVDEKQ